MIIEDCFRRMKTTGLKVRPVFHWTEHRIRAHVKLCVLALLLQRVAELACQDTWRNIRRELATMKAIECETGAGTFVRRTRASKPARGYLAALKLPEPPKVLATSTG